jgi:putative transposase
MAECAGIGDGEKAQDTRAVRAEVIRGFGGHVRVRRVHADLAAWGVPAGPELVRSLMRELGLEPCQPWPWRVSLTEGDGQEHDIPDLMARDFTADAPGQKMVGDITYIPTWEGWLFPLATST